MNEFTEEQLRRLYGDELLARARRIVRPGLPLCEAVLVAVDERDEAERQHALTILRSSVISNPDPIKISECEPPPSVASDRR